MNKKYSVSMVSVFLTLLAVMSANAQSAYFQAITNLNPVGYWPMHEVEAAAPGDIETNYGTLGVLGTGYYPDWVSGSASAFQHQVSGAIVADSDEAMYFKTYYSASVGTPDFTNSMFIPHTSPLSTLNPPFSVECWYYTTETSRGNDIWSQNGYEGLNAGLTGNNNGSAAGIRLFASGTGMTLYTFDPGQNNLGNITGLSNNQWYHIVVTCDSQTNFSVYVNDIEELTSVTGFKKYTPDYWTPFEIGNGRGNERAMDCDIDELAIYTNVIGDIHQHYSDGTNAAPATSYYQDVINDNPVIYLRMDSPAYSAPDVSTWPVLTNYGSVAVNGVYTPGTMPGVVSGPAIPSGVPFGGLSGGNVAQFSGISSYADAGYATAYDPTGTVPFTVTAMFRGNPCDGRTNSIVGHSDNSWHILLDPLGQLQCRLGTNTASQITSTGIYNDGNWHQLVEVYTPNSNPNLPGTNALYVDGVLDTAVSTVTTNGFGPGSPMDVLIGSDPQHTNNPTGAGQQFAGQVCEVALFTNALTAAQVQTLDNAAGVPVFITTPPGSYTVNQGTAFTNTVVAGGSTPLYYQWYTNDVAIDDQTNASLIFNPVLGGDASTNYYVIITNDFGSVTSAVVSLTVNTSPVVLAQFPLTYTNLFTLYAGANPNFSVSASGVVPLYYQWYTNGVLDGMATNFSFAMTNVQIGLFSNYCVVSNAIGSITTAVWSASVITDPTNSTGGLAPYPQAVLALNPIAYWRLNEPDDGNYDGNPGAVCHDFVGGNDGLYTNVYLGNATVGPGYNPTTDPSDSPAEFGYYHNPDSYAGSIGTNINFGVPANNNAEFTAEAWVNGEGFAQPGNAGIVTKGYFFHEQLDLDEGGPNNNFRFEVRDAAGNVYNASGSYNATNTFGWVHLVGVCDEANSNVLLYVNGSLAGSVAIPPLSGITNSLSDPMSIGARAQNSATGFNSQFLGLINDVAVFNYALTPDEVANEYAAGGGTVAPYFFPTPSTSASAGVNTMLTIPVTAIGTPPMSYVWTNVTTSAAIATGSTNTSATLNATLNYANVPANWDGDQLELIVTNAYGTTNAYFTLSITNTVNQNPTNIVFSATSTNLTLTWPMDHTGWRLQSQTNGLSVGISTNWFDVSGSTATNQVVIPVNLTNGSVFYRLVYP